MQVRASGPFRAAPEGIDTSIPSIARVMDAVLGGKDNFEVDRQVAKQLTEISPAIVTAVRDNRAWLSRVVGFLADQAGIDQFLDCGSGLPTAENTHEMAQRINPDAVVVYVDNDPVVDAYGKAILAENDHTAMVAADIRDPATLFADAEVARLLDLSRPLGLLHVGILDCIPDDESYDLVARYRDVLAPGSYYAVSHLYNPRDGSGIARCADEMEKIHAAAGGGMSNLSFRTKPEIERFFEGFELLEPGLGPMALWWPTGPLSEPMTDARQIGICGVARKP